MEGHLTMSATERKRKDAFLLVRRGVWTLKEACEHLGLSYRQGKRSYARFRSEGDKGLVHLRRGKPSNRCKDEAVRSAALSLYRERFMELEMGPTLAAEKLASAGIEVDHETLRRWLLAAGLWKRRRKRAKHRRQRPRHARFGELVQIDGSHHRWFWKQEAESCLMVAIDDATNTTMAFLSEEETTEAAMRLLWAWIERYGIPWAVYTDRKNVYITEREPTVDEQLAGQQPLTAFGKGCHKLGVKIITARSAQAKGRVERRHGVFQDRFIKELALEKITTLDGANGLLRNGFTNDINTRFCEEASDPRDAHRRLSKSIKLEDVFCYEETRIVTNDWTISWNNQRYQILADNRPAPKPKDKVTVRIRLDKTLHILFKNRPLRYELARAPKIKVAKPKTKKMRKPAASGTSRSKPAADHPWRDRICSPKAKP